MDDEEPSMPPRPQEFKSGIEKDLEEMRQRIEEKGSDSCDDASVRNL